MTYKEDEIRRRVLLGAKYIVGNKTTIRRCAEYVGVSKTTVHKDITERLPKLYPQYYAQVLEVINYNKEIRSMRGGLATKHKWEKIKGRKRYEEGKELREELGRLRGAISKDTIKTINGQIKSGDIEAAKKGIETEI